jgi:hypothetical protein
MGLLDEPGPRAFKRHRAAVWFTAGIVMGSAIGAVGYAAYSAGNWALGSWTGSHAHHDADSKPSK